MSVTLSNHLHCFLNTNTARNDDPFRGVAPRFGKTNNEIYTIAFFLHVHHNPANQDLDADRQLFDDTYISGIYVWNVSGINIRFASLSGKKLSLVVFGCRLFNAKI